MMGECRYDLVPASDASVRDTDQNTVPVYVDFQNTAQTKSTIQTQHLTSSSTGSSEEERLHLRQTYSRNPSLRTSQRGN